VKHAICVIKSVMKNIFLTVVLATICQSCTTTDQTEKVVAKPKLTRADADKLDIGPKPSDAKALQLIKEWTEVNLGNSQSANYEFLQSAGKTLDDETDIYGWLVTVAINQKNIHQFIIRRNVLSHFMNHSELGAQLTDNSSWGRDVRILEIINGTYEVVAWNNGVKTHKPPAVSGRWVFRDKKVMSIIHNRTDPNSHKSSIGWGNGTVKRGKFQYTYTEQMNLQGTMENSSLTFGPPWKGMRSFNVEFLQNGIKMTSENDKQTWIINKNGMVYTDREWGPNKVYAQRKWKRISN
jgi:hypothetical protein